MPKCLFLKSHVDHGYVSLYIERFREHAFREASPLLAAIAEPVARPALVHEYFITPFSLGVAVTSGVTFDNVVEFLREYVYGYSQASLLSFSSQQQDPALTFIRSCMEQYNLVSIVTEESGLFVHCTTQELALRLLKDTIMKSLCVKPLRLLMTKRSGNGADTVRLHETDFHVSEAAESSASEYYARFQLQDRASAKLASERCTELGVPITQKYAFDSDKSLRTIRMSLKSQTKPRPYQIEAVQSCTGDGVLRSGILVLPCGAGKTLVGVMVCCAVRKPALIICASSISVEQWKNQLLEFASLLPPESDDGSATNSSGGPHRGANAAQQSAAGPFRISCLTAKQKDPISDSTDVVITTYSMLVMAHKAHMRRLAQRATQQVAIPATVQEHMATRSKRSSNDAKEMLFQPWGLLLLDEVHVMPADIFRESISYIDAKGVIGLTATCVREDKKIGDLFHLVGPKLFDVSWEALAAQGYLAQVTCVEVHVPMTTEFSMEYLERSRSAATRHNREVTLPNSSHRKEGTNVSHRLRQADSAATHAAGSPVLSLLAASNPNKMLCVLQLVRRHLQESAKILVFCDHIIILKEYGRLLDAPVICGETPHKDRLMIFSDFQTTTKVNVVCVSRVGDVSVNLPSASVVIQVSSHGGSRRQEAQRLGRILRPKEKAADGKHVAAWFYSIVSMDTVELAYASHRTAFLVDQGYTCRVVEFQMGSSYSTEICSVKRDNAGDDIAEDDGFPANSARGESAVVGDVAGIKREVLQLDAQTPRLLNSTTRTASTKRILSKRWQIEFLAKIVSRWELDLFKANGGMSSKRKRENEGVNSAVGISPLSQYQRGNSRSSQDKPQLDFASVKREWQRRGGGALDEVQTHPIPCDITLQDATHVDTDVVYHEL